MAAIRYVQFLLIGASLFTSLLLVWVGFQQHLLEQQVAPKPCVTCKYQAVYGNHTIIEYNELGQCKQQILLLGVHNSGTSMVARLLTLFGIWVGEPQQLQIGKNNKLKWWERKDVMLLNDELTKNHTNPSYPTWIGIGFNPHLVLPNQRRWFHRSAQGILDDLNRFCPWLIKDPRLCFVGSMWMELMPKPVCIIVYRHPARVALRLGQHWYKGAFARLNSAAWLTIWEHMMTSALRTCRGVPTMIVQSALTTPDNLEMFYDVTHAGLLKLGITNVTRPPPHVVQEQYVDYYKPTHQLDNKTNDDMSERCKYQEVTPELFLKNKMEGLQQYIDLLKAWPADCAIKAHESTRALVLAFEKVLAQQYSKTREIKPKMLAQTVLKYQEDLIYDMGMEQQ